MPHASLRAAHMTAALVLAGLVQAPPARANIVFDLSGTCTVGAPCVGTATGVLTLADSYVFGTVMTTADFISFTYSSSSRSFQLSGADPAIDVNFGTVGGINADGSLFGGEWAVGSSAAAALFDWTPPTFFAANSAGPALDDSLAPYKFTLVSGAAPEPSTWAMMLLGFAGLGFAGYRRVGRAALA
jgi:hypothetical protein